MELKYSKDSLEIKRVLSGMDKFLLDFVRILNLLKIRYVIISGYVAILFGRSRATEDIDMFVDNIGKETFTRLLKEIEKKGLWILNCSYHLLRFR